MSKDEQQRLRPLSQKKKMGLCACPLVHVRSAQKIARSQFKVASAKSRGHTFSEGRTRHIRWARAGGQWMTVCAVPGGNRKGEKTELSEQKKKKKNKKKKKEKKK